MPGDYVDVLRTAVPEAVAAAGIDPADVIGIGTDFTACTMVPITADGTPLCELARVRRAARTPTSSSGSTTPPSRRPTGSTRWPRERGESWLPRYGGLISSEWEFAKGLQLLEEAPEVYAAMDRWVEAADWIVWQLCGTYVRNACTAGYKGILPGRRLPVAGVPRGAEPRLRATSSRSKLEHPIGQLGAARRRASPPQAAAWTGLPEGIAVAVGNVDAHVTAPAAQAVEPGQMVAIMGTSTCHVMNGDALARGARACAASSTAGSSPGSGATRPGRAASATSSPGSSTTSVPASYARGRGRAPASALHEHLTDAGGRSSAVGEHGLVALDWHSGNRSVLVDHELSGVIVGPDAGDPARGRSTGR